MGMRAFYVGRRALLAASTLAAGTLVGCQSPGVQFAQPGVARGDQKSPVSPAFAQVEAGRQMANNPGRMSGPMAMQQPGTMQGMPMASNQTTMGGTPVMGSGGMVYPVAYSPNGPTAMQPQMVPMQNMAVPAMYPQPQMMTGQPMPAMSMPVQPAMTQPVMMQGQTGMPTTIMVNGPNGPQQYMLVESPQTVATPPVIQPVAAPAPAITPVSTTPAPEPVPAPAPVQAPTFTAPPPASIPTPSPIPLPAPIEMSSKAPEMLPPAVVSKPPTGPVLPASNQEGPSLGSFPAAPTMAPPASPKLPPAGAATDDFIPSAPIFLPSSR